MNNGTPTTESIVDTLNELLRGELSAVESYNKAMPALENDVNEANVAADLQRCRASHQERAERLRAAIVQMGGEPSHAAGAWGLFARAVTTSSRVLGWKAVISTLEEGEDHGLEEYKDALPRLDQGTQRLVSDELYPQQVHTHNVLSSLKRVASA
jgi:bacterioferritin (cytochrome b1)